MKILHLTIKKKWFDMIASGEKIEEYRTIKEYWTTRLVNREYDAVLFRNGYEKDSPRLLIEYKGFHEGFGMVPEWGAPAREKVYILRLGEIIS